MDEKVKLAQAEKLLAEAELKRVESEHVRNQLAKKGQETSFQPKSDLGCELQDIELQLRELGVPEDQIRKAIFDRIGASTGF